MMIKSGDGDDSYTSCLLFCIKKNFPKNRAPFVDKVVTARTSSSVLAEY